MSFDKAVQGAIETLKMNKTKNKGLPTTYKDSRFYTDFFAEKSPYLDHLGLSWRQRMGCAAISFVFMAFFLFSSLTQIIRIPFSPEAFGRPFTLCSFSFVATLCFFSGFRTVFKNSTASDMLPYSASYVTNSVLVLLCRNWLHPIRLAVSLFELLVFLGFVYAYLTRKFKLGAARTLSAISFFK